MFAEVDEDLFGHGAAEYSDDENAFAQNSGNEEERGMAKDGYKIGDFSRMFINWDNEGETASLMQEEM